MTLPELVKAARQWWWILLLCPLIAAGTAYYVSTLITPVYEAEATALIEHHIGEGTGSDLQSIQAAERRTQTLNQLVNTRSVLAPTIESLELDITLEELREKVSVTHQRETQLVTIAVQHPHPEHAALIANEITEQFSAYIQEIQAGTGAQPGEEIVQALNDLEFQIALAEMRIEELEAGDGPATLAQSSELGQWQVLLDQLRQSQSTLALVQEALAQGNPASGSQVYVVEPAAAPTSPVSPRILLNTVLAGILGLLFGSGLMVGISWLDDNVKTEQDLRETVQRPVLGAIPSGNLPEQVDYMHSGKSITGEIFRGLRTNLQFTMVDRNVKSIVITSAAPGEGKTTVAANLAIVLAQGGQRVILVDADMRRPRIHNLFNRVRNDRGLSNLLLQPTAQIEEMLQSTAIKNLLVLATGPVPPNPADLFGSVRMHALVHGLEEKADIVVFDSPPVAISDSLLLSSLSGGIIFVTRAGKLRSAEITQSIETISQSGAPILGVVLNGVRPQSQANYRVYQQYYPLANDDGQEPVQKRRLGWLRGVFGRSA